MTCHSSTLNWRAFRFIQSEDKNTDETEKNSKGKSDKSIQIRGTVTFVFGPGQVVFGNCGVVLGDLSSETTNGIIEN